MFDQLTEAVRRILAEAAKLADSRQRSSIEPVDLLWALIRDESRGSEILERMVINAGAFKHYWPDYPVDLPPDSSPSAIDPVLRLSTSCEDILTAATQAAAEAGRYAEIGSEHLLWGLLAVDSEACQFLHERGMSSSELESDLVQQSGFETEPILVEEKLTIAGPSSADRTDVWRILDATTNRCSEGMRVIEDIVRFQQEDRLITRLLKEWRHDFSELVRQLPLGQRLGMRDSTGDVGTTISTPQEQQRQSMTDLLIANFKRVAESLRSIEESGKLLGPAYRDVPKQAEQLRYRVYTLEKTLIRGMSISPQLLTAKLYLLLTASLCATSARQVLEESLANGVDVIQLREKSLDSQAFLKFALSAREATRNADALLIINDRPDIALLCDADGVHLGQDDLTIAQARRILGPDKLIGRSTHSLAQAQAAVMEGADYLGVGPVFPSETKQFSEQVGLELIQQAATEISLPWFAIGGITENNLDEVLTAGARRVAVCGTLCGSQEPRYAASRFSQRLKNALES